MASTDAAAANGECWASYHSADTIAAIGDSDNDAAMLKAASIRSHGRRHSRHQAFTKCGFTTTDIHELAGRLQKERVGLVMRLSLLRRRTAFVPIDCDAAQHAAGHGRGISSVVYSSLQGRKVICPSRLRSLQWRRPKTRNGA